MQVNKSNHLIGSKPVVKPYTLRELAALYEIGWRSFKRWIEPFRSEIGPMRGRYLTIPQVKVIFEKLDYPPCFQQ